VTVNNPEVGWALHKWWRTDKQNRVVQIRTKLCDYLEWLNKNPVGMGYPQDRHAAYLALIDEYYRQ
jgi:hypothetical protein